MRNYIGLIIILALGSSCAISRKVPYNDLNLNLPKVSAKSISIAVWDQRSQVLDKSRKPDFVGYLRSVAGIAYPMGTSSGKAYADDIATDLTSSFQKNGCSAKMIPTSYEDSEKTILEKLKNSNSEKLVLIKCNKLLTDGYTSFDLFFNLNVSVYQSNGEIIDQKTFEGNKPLGKGPKFETYLPKGFQEFIEEVFNDPNILSAINR